MSETPPTAKPSILKNVIADFLKSGPYPNDVTSVEITPTNAIFTLVFPRNSDGTIRYPEQQPIISQPSSTEVHEKLEASAVEAEKLFEDLRAYRSALYEALHAAGQMLEGSDELWTLKSLQVAASLRVTDVCKKLTNLRTELDEYGRKEKTP